MQGCTNSRYQVAVANEFCTIGPNIGGTSLWNLFHATILAPRTMKRFLDFWKICISLCVCLCTHTHTHTHILSIKLYCHLRTVQNAKIQAHLNVMLHVYPLSCFKKRRSPCKNRFTETLQRGNEVNGKKGHEIWESTQKIQTRSWRGNGLGVVCNSWRKRESERILL